MMTLSQLAAAVTDPASVSLTDYVLRGLGSLVMVAVAWLVKTVHGISKTMDRWDVEFFGINGDNGMRGNVKTLMKEREENMKGRRHGNRHNDDNP